MGEALSFNEHEYEKSLETRIASLQSENARLKELLERCRAWVDAGTDLHKSIDAVLEGDEDGG